MKVLDVYFQATLQAHLTLIIINDKLLAFSDIPKITYMQ